MAEKRFKRVSSSDKPNGNVSKKVAPRPVSDDEDDEPMTLGGSRASSQVPDYEEAEIRGGWGAAQETIDSTSNYAQSFRTSKDTQIIKFLDAQPYAAFRRHWVNRVGVGLRPYVCFQSVGKDCPLCDVGDKPGAVMAFNVALCSDDGQATVKSWDCGVKLTQQLRTYNNDPKIGPIDKPGLYFAVSKSEATQRQQVSTMVNPVRERDLQEDWGTLPIAAPQLARLMDKCYTVDIITMPTRRDLEEVAAEITGEDTGKPWGS